MSQAIWICRDNGSMSGARRALTNTLGSNFFSAACFSPLFRTADNVASMGRKVSTDIEYIEIFIPAPKGEWNRRFYSASGAGASLMKQ